MKRIKNAKLISAIASIALAVMIAGTPSAFAMTMPAGQNSTKILIQLGNPTCSIGGYAPEDVSDYELDSNPDTVNVPFAIDWEDQRTAGQPTSAKHYFFLQTEHLGSTQAVDKTVYTNGGVTTTYDTLSLNVTNVYDGQYVNITYAADLSLSGGQYCPASGNFTGHYHFLLG